jgi:hypothetical protein
MTSKLEQLKALRERGQGGVRADKQKRAMRRASDRPAKAITKAMLDDAVRAASAIPPKLRKKPREKK